MITLYELLKRAKKGEVLYTARPARNATSAASRTGRKIETQNVYIVPIGRGGIGLYGEKILKIKVVS